MERERKKERGKGTNFVCSIVYCLRVYEIASKLFSGVTTNKILMSM